MDWTKSATTALTLFHQEETLFLFSYVFPYFFPTTWQRIAEFVFPNFPLPIFGVSQTMISQF